MKKRLLAFLLVLVMVAGFVPVTARAEGTGTVTPYISGMRFQFVISDITTKIEVPVDQYNPDTGNVYEIGYPRGTAPHPYLFVTIADGIDADDLYCSASRGTTQEAIDYTAFTNMKLTKLAESGRSIGNFGGMLYTFGQEQWLKLTIGRGTELNDPQTYYFHAKTSVYLKSISATDLEGNPLSVVRNNRTLFLDYSSDTVFLTCTAADPDVTRYKIGNQILQSGENTEVDLTPFPKDADGIRFIPLAAEYTGESDVAGFDYTLRVDPNNYLPVVAPYDQNPINCNQDDDVSFTVNATVTKGTLSYKWFWSRGAGIMQEVAGATEATLHPSTAYSGTDTYRCQVTNTIDGFTFTSRSEDMDVVIAPTHASPPNITAITQATTCFQNAEQKISVTASPNDQAGTLTYQWYVNTENSNQGGTLIDGATHNQVLVDTSVAGVFYYYCNVIASIELPDGTISTNSEAFSSPIQVTVQAPGELFSGSGTADDPFLLQKPSEFTTLKNIVNTGSNTMAGYYFKMTKDITLPSTWEPIGVTKDGTTNLQNGNNVNWFSGNIDGGGYTLTVRAGKAPLLGYVKNAVVKNLGIYGTQINGYGLVNNYEGVGLSGEAIVIDNVTLKSGTKTLKSGLIGGNITVNSLAAASAGYYVTIRNCTVESGVTVGYDGTQSMIGGIAGRINGTIENCINNGTVLGVDIVGGIVASEDNATGGLVVNNCQFNGIVTATGDRVGGIVGGGYKHATAPNAICVIIDGCSASGTVTGGKTVGGIFGGEDGVDQNWSPASISGNSFTGTVSGSENVGAIVGYMSCLNKNNVFENNTFRSGCGADSAFGTVYMIDTSAVQVGLHDGVYYYNSSANYTDAQWAEIFDYMWAPWKDYGRGKPSLTFNFKTNMNRTDNPLNCDATAITIAVTTMPTKTEYLTGEDFNPTGLVVTLTDLNGATRELTSDEYTLSGFDSASVGEKIITVTFGEAITTFTVTVSAPAGETITVSFSVLGDTHHEMSEGNHGLWLGGLTTWLAETQYTVSANATVWDLINQAFNADDTLSFEHSFNTSYNSEYISAVQKGDVKLTEKDDGRANSGWMYALNGEHVQVGVSNQHLTDGDAVILHWCDDYQADEAAAGQQQQDQQAAYAVEALIDAIGTPVTLESEDAIVAARTAYDALTDNAKSYVDPDCYAILTAAEAALAELKASAQRVADVIAAINAIGEVTLDSADAINTARTAYNALTDDEKALVTNYTTLTAAETALAALHQAEIDQAAADAVIALINALPTEVALTDEATITEARAAYNALTNAQKALVTNIDALTTAETALQTLQDQAAAGSVNDAISALPAADAITLDDEAAVAAARAAYDALTPAQQALVDDSALVAAENAINQLKAEAVTNLIAALPAADAVTLDNEADIAAARAAYDALTDAQKALVDASALVAAEARITELKFGTVKPVVKAENDKKTGKIQLTITPVAGAVKYHILVADKADGTYTEAAAITGTTYTYEGTPGTQYFFKVVAVNGAGVESAESAVASLFRLPAQVTSLKVKSKKKKEVTLTWKKVTGAKKYVIYMSKNGKTGWKKIGTVKTNKFTYKKAPAGKKMYFRVQAITANGKKGEFSKAVSVKVKK